MPIKNRSNDTIVYTGICAKARRRSDRTKGIDTSFDGNCANGHARLGKCRRLNVCHTSSAGVKLRRIPFRMFCSPDEHYGAVCGKLSEMAPLSSQRLPLPHVSASRPIATCGAGGICLTAHFRAMPEWRPKWIQGKRNAHSFSLPALRASAGAGDRDNAGIRCSNAPPAIP